MPTGDSSGSGIARGGRIPRLIDVPVGHGRSLSALHYSGGHLPGPAVVLLTPYRKEGAWLTYPSTTIAEGYDVLVVDVRATGGSSGPFEGPLSQGEIDDAVALLEWTAAQSFCDGRTALIGSSYSGLIQYHVAARRPESLRCIAPSIAPADNYRDMTHRGGIPSTAAWYSSTYGLSGQADTRRQGLVQAAEDLEAPFDGPAARARSATSELLSRIDVPVLCMGGLYDLFTASTVAAYRALRTPTRLLLGDWGHETEMSVREARELSRWLAFWLRDEGTDPTRDDHRVTAYRAGDRTWHALASWPHAGGTEWMTAQVTDRAVDVPVAPLLDAVPPPETTAMSDPTIDMLIDSGLRTWGELWTVDLPAPRSRTDFAGPALVTINLVTECADIDAHVRVSLVRTSDEVEQLVEGRLRASHRMVDPARSLQAADGRLVVPWRTHEKAEGIPASEPVCLQIATSPLHVRVERGERLRLGVTLVRADGRLEPATATVQASSRIEVPISDPATHRSTGRDC